VSQTRLGAASRVMRLAGSSRPFRLSRKSYTELF
jgi:hypothetical protein